MTYAQLGELNGLLARAADRAAAQGDPRHPSAIADELLHQAGVNLIPLLDRLRRQVASPGPGTACHA